MQRYVLTRLAVFPLALLIISAIVFLMLYMLPGDPAEALLGPNVVSADQVEQLREQLGLNDPLHIQYGRFLGGALRGDFGRSLRSRRPVFEELLTQLPATLELTFGALGLAIAIGFPLGLLAALRPNTWIDSLSMLIAVAGLAMPSFWLCLLLIFFFSVHLGWFPATGQGGLERLVLPVFALGYYAASLIARLVRSATLEVLRQDYITTARAKGLAGSVVMYRHVMRNALIPVITILGVQFGFLLGGTVIVETIFGRPGIGRLLIDGILYQDYRVVQATIIFIAMGFLTTNLVVDIIYGLIDPRIRYD
ncbi:MAG: ABC transporter permease [Dehalococcoidia bacterium]|nr:ABC transporter permease [Dehalococcoidia bacterium]